MKRKIIKVLFLLFVVGITVILNYHMFDFQSEKGIASIEALIQNSIAQPESGEKYYIMHECNCYVNGSGKIEDFCGSVVDCWDNGNNDCYDTSCTGPCSCG
jgi:hypothetical protein